MSTTTTTAFEDSLRQIERGESLETAVEALLAQLTQEEKLWLLDGDQEFWPAIAEMSQAYNARPIIMGAIERLGIPGLRFSDGPRGVVMGASTAFPVSMARGATWDLDLEERIGIAIGRELRAQGANFFGGVCINLPRHPAWGRAQETYGEDPYLLGEFGAALIRGVHRNAMAVAKHYALNSMENARFTVDVRADDSTLHEVFLPHFRRAVEEGVDGIMTSYNSVNGDWAGQNEVLLEGILRRQWGFQGVTVSDFISGIRGAAVSLVAGLDVEEPARQQRAAHLADELAAGEASWEHVDRAARRILRTQLAYYASDLEPQPNPSVVFSREHRELAREVAQRSMVLLRNETIGDAPLLPLDASSLSRVAVIGRLAGVPNTGDHGSSDVHSPEVTTALDGIVAALPNATVTHVEADDPDAAALAATKADVAIVVVGYTADDEGEYLGTDAMNNPDLLALFPPMPEGMMLGGEPGATATAMGTAEGGDRASLRLRPVDEEIILATAAANPRTVVVVVTAGAVITERWRTEVPATVISWYSGCEGGHALADVLLGRVDASGRLPYSIPTSEEHLPFFDREATSIVYDRWFGQRLLDRDGHPAAYPLGFGLSYTTFHIDQVEAHPVDGEHFTAAATVANTGSRRGRHVVQLYGVIHAADFPSRVLLGFATVELEPGQTRTVEVGASTRPLQRWTGDGFVPAATHATLEAAAYAGDPDAATTALDLH
ncbi:glycoside hydrolase family 3 C-terminal domain-containing protein [Leifsonia sp. F6_8S_P_1B]|uniref:Glycoside hydrolase family 3 C-terminal domain-containing protein n=1 Tax=Leifsonia williamsii TaxID=3035919 RepID=A0ABT8KFX6_9MICO|nr:glycoside hydrolase family 3 C-terminal domain-containing protein [Leifsonia williamsii]MDN4616355.1 glycoside hydrolase family 3 C-terminal domain-containing protein [Leifsonia williamsii]